MSSASARRAASASMSRSTDMRSVLRPFTDRSAPWLPQSGRPSPGRNRRNSATGRPETTRHRAMAPMPQPVKHGQKGGGHDHILRTPRQVHEATVEIEENRQPPGIGARKRRWCHLSAPMTVFAPDYNRWRAVMAGVAVRARVRPPACTQTPYRCPFAQSESAGLVSGLSPPVPRNRRRMPPTGRAATARGTRR